MAVNEDVAKENRELQQKRHQRHQGGPMGIGRVTEKPKNFKTSILRLLGYFKPYLVLIIITFILSGASTLLNTYIPSVLADIVDVIKDGLDIGAIDFDQVKSIVAFAAFIYVIVVVFQLVQQFAMIEVSQKMVYNFRREINHKLNKLPLSYFDSHSRGDILSRVANDVENIAMSLQQSLNQVVTAVITVVAVVVFMLMRSVLLTFVSFITVFLCILMTKVIAKKAKAYFTEQWASTGDLNGQIEEMYTGHNIVKVFNRQEEAAVRFTKENQRLYESSFKAQFISGIIMPAMSVLNNLNYVVICVIGGLKVIAGTMTLGDITAIISYSKQLMQPIMQTANIASTIQSTVASAERVFDLLDAEEEVPEAEEPIELVDPKVIRFENVDFSYKPDTKLIENLNIEVKPGDMIAIVGPTGAGKTTLVNLLMRFYEIDGGAITIDGVDIRDVTRENLRGHIGMVLQDAWLFNGTIRDNIRYGFNPEKGEPTEEQIVEAARAAYVDHFVKTLPEGYDTVINDDATNISQGQKQLMTIARAFLSDPSILILDEATSSVDTRTEVLIQKAMAKLMAGRTSFVIAHRLSTIRDADTILVMNNGTIIEQGNHEQLLAAKGFYYDLYNSQFLGAAVEEEEAAAESTGFSGFPNFGGFSGGGKFPSGGFPGKGGKVKGNMPDFSKLKEGEKPEGFPEFKEGERPEGFPKFEGGEMPEGFPPFDEIAAPDVSQQKSEKQSEE